MMKASVALLLAMGFSNALKDSRKNLSMRYTRQYVGINGAVRRDGDTENNFDAVARDAAKIIQSGMFDLIAWDMEVYNGATRGFEAYWGQPSREPQWPMKPTLWVFDGPTGLGIPIGCWPDSVTPDRYYVAGCYVYPSDRRFGDVQIPGHGFMWFFLPLVHDEEAKEEGVPVLWEPGTIYGAPMTENDAVICAANEFLKLPFTEVAVHHLNHQERKAIKKSNARVPEVKTVLLRRALATGGSQVAYGSECDRQYSCQWLVGAHWRRPNARMKEQRPVYVRPYIKGPTDKPFKAARTVYLASR